MPSELFSIRRRDGDGNPVFDEQWHAQVIATVEVLIADGTIDAGHWSKTLGGEIDKCAEQGSPDNDATYYGAFLSALQIILAKTGAVSQGELDQRDHDWRQAYLTTPHGKPVMLKD